MFLADAFMKNGIFLLNSDCNYSLLMNTFRLGKQHNQEKKRISKCLLRVCVIFKKKDNKSYCPWSVRGHIVFGIDLELICYMIRPKLTLA